MNAIGVRRLFSENRLFAQGGKAGDFTFLAQDARSPEGTVGELRGAKEQAEQTLANLDTLLKTTGQSLENLTTLSVYLPDYADAEAVTDPLAAKCTNNCPAINIVGVCALEGDCRVRMDAISTTSKDHETILVPGMPLSTGARCHGARVGEFMFLSGVDAADSKGRVAPSPNIQAQTTEAAGTSASRHPTQA